MPRVQFQEDTALPFGGEARFFKAGAWYTLGTAHLNLIKRNKLSYIEENAVETDMPVEAKAPAPEEQLDEEILEAMETLITKSNPSDFTSAYVIKSKALRRELGYPISVEARDKHWEHLLGK